MPDKLKRRGPSGASWGLLLLGLASLAVGPAIAEVYQWRDEQGQLHFGDRPPPDAEHQRFEHSGGIADDPAPQEEPPATAPAAGEAPTDCAAARQQLADYEQSERIVERDEDGTQRVLDAQERASLIALQRDLVERLCED